MAKSVKIVAMGKYLPTAVSSESIEDKYNIPKGWAFKNSGVASRHYALTESAGFMGARAIENTLERAKMSLGAIDLIISASATFDYPLPSQSSIIKSELKEGHKYDTSTLDVDATCLSFVSAFEMAANLLNGKQYKNIIIVSAEIASKGLNPANWETLTLFGDAAVATILTYDENSDSKFIKAGQRTYSEGVNYTTIKGGGNQYHAKDYPYNAELYSFAMSGKNLLRLAKRKYPEFSNWFFNDLDVGITDVDVIIPHQASRMGIALFLKMFDFKPGQIRGNLAQHGNCIAASIPLLLCEQIELGQIQRGQTVLLTGTSAGFSIGSILLTY